MTITRVQQVSAVLTGTSDTVTMPSAPTYGNTLVAVLARANAAPVAASLTQTNVVWASVLSGNNDREVAHQVFVAQNIGPAAGDTITVTRADPDDYAVVVFEYSGLLKTGTILDSTVTASQDGQTPYTGAGPATTQDDELFLAAIAHTVPDRLLDDNLDSDQGYWRADSSVTSSIAFGGGTATVAGAMYAEPSGSSAWSNYRIAADVSGNSPAAGGNGWFGLGIYTAGDFLLPTANGYAGLINTFDNTVYSIKAVNGSLSFNAYPYGGYGTLNPLQVYRLELRARTSQAGDVTLEFYVDGTLIFTESHSGGPTAGSGGLAVSAATPQTATFNSLLVTGLSDERVPQYGPTNGFVEAEQSSVADIAASRTTLAVFEKVVDAIETPDITVQTDRSVVWNSRLFTLLADPSVTVTAPVDIDAFIADLIETVLTLDQYIAETKTTSLSLDFWIQTILELEIQVLIDGAALADLDVLVDPTTDRRVALDVEISGTVYKTVALQPNVGIGTFELTANLNAHVGTTDYGPSKNPIRLTPRMDVAVLRPPAGTDAITTPEGSVYLTCRPIWCNVPRRGLLDTTLNVLVGGVPWLRASLEVSVRYEDWYERRGERHVTMRVLLDS